jgi:superfamily II DNA or RNA helicase
VLVAREYQQRGLDRGRAHFRAGKKSVCLVAPTGAGKTVMIAIAAVGHSERGGRTVVLVHRDELLRQTLDKLWKAGLRDIGAVAANGGFNPTARTVVCSIQTLLARGARPDATLLIPDECHHFLAEQWNQVARHYAGVPTLGFTATPMRSDGTALGNMFDALEVVATNAELVAAGHLVPIDVIGPPHRLDKTNILDPVAQYEKHGAERPFVCFAASRAHGKELAARFGDGVAYVDGDTKDRDKILHALEQGRLRGVVNVFVLTEGWDCPPVEVCVLARGCESAATFIQMVGRVRRPHEGKSGSLLIDCKGAVYEHGLPDSERVFSLRGNPIRLADGLPPIRQCPQCAAVFPTAPSCERCGYVWPIDRHEVREVSGEARPVDNVTPESAKHAFLRGQLAKARVDGKKPGWAAYRFRWRFGHWPPPAWLKEEANVS